MVKVKFINDRDSLEKLRDNYSKYYTKDGSYSWGQVEMVLEDPDFYVIFDRTSDMVYKEEYKNNGLLFNVEPQMYRSSSNFGIWEDPPKNMFRLKRYFNVFWSVGSYRFLKEHKIEKTQMLSSVMTDKIQCNGQKKRFMFLKSLDSLPYFNHYGKGNFSQFMTHYRGEIENKADGLFPYKYTYAAENCQEENYFTEKIIDAILSECLCFYWGCPKLHEHIDPRTFIYLDLNDYNKSLLIVQKAILDCEWEQRIDAIRVEKQRILDKMSILPVLDRMFAGGL